MELVNPAFHPEPGRRETDPQTKLPHLLLFWFRQVGRGPKVWLMGAEPAEGLKRSSVDGRQEEQVFLEQVWGIVGAKIIGDGRGEVSLVRRAVLRSVKESVRLLEDLEIVREKRVIVQKPPDEGRKIVGSGRGGSGEDVGH